jgi:very-short-patch-repair endonuclease
VGIVSHFDRTKPKTALARRLRSDSTDVELKLWHRLRAGQIEGARFRRQHPAGPYVLDFYCPALGLAIELDGGQHASMIQRDQKRDLWLKERDVTVLRVWNIDVVTNLGGVLEMIRAKIAELRSAGATPTRRWRADLPLSGRGTERRGRI